MPREFAYNPSTPRRRFGVPAVGFTLTVPDNVTIIPGGAALFHATEQRGDRLLGDLELSLINAKLIMDRGGVLEDLAQQAAAELTLPPHQATLSRGSAIRLDGGEGYRVDMRILVDEAGRRPPRLPYLSTLALGHSDVLVPAALFAVVRAAMDPWLAGEEMLDSLRFK